MTYVKFNTERKHAHHSQRGKIKRWREERCWSQEHMADVAGVGLRTIQRMENGSPVSRDTVMALAAAFDVDAMAITLDAEVEAQRDIIKRQSEAQNVLRVLFLINLACWAFGMLVFAGISLSDGAGGYSMAVPAIWWTVGVAGLALTWALVEIVARAQREKV